MTAEELRAWMATHGYSVRGLAAALGVHRNTVDGWRQGELPISRTVELALRTLECEPPQWRGGTRS